MCAGGNKEYICFNLEREKKYVYQNINKEFVQGYDITNFQMYFRPIGNVPTNVFIFVTSCSGILTLSHSSLFFPLTQEPSPLFTCNGSFSSIVDESFRILTFSHKSNEIRFFWLRPFSTFGITCLFLVPSDFTDLYKTLFPCFYRTQVR